MLLGVNKLRAGVGIRNWVSDNDIPGYSLRYEKFRQAKSP